MEEKKKNEIGKEKETERDGDEKGMRNSLENRSIGEKLPPHSKFCYVM